MSSLQNSPLPSGLALETNWIVDVALQRDLGSERLWTLARDGQLTVYLPSVCVAESVKVLEAQFRSWRNVSGRLQQVAAEARRSSLLSSFADPLDQAQSALVVLQDTIEAQFWKVLEEICSRARLLEPTAGALSNAGAMRELLKLSPADALVLGTLVDALRHGGPTNLMSRDKRAFDTPEVRVYFEAVGISHYADARTFLRATRTS